MFDWSEFWTTLCKLNLNKNNPQKIIYSDEEKNHEKFM